MRLGLKRDEVRLENYTPEWKEEFNRVKDQIIESTNLDETRIQHIGSTAIKGMAAKPILDILVGVDDLQEVDGRIITGLRKIGFLRLKVDRPGEIVFAKFTDETYEEKTHFIHLVEYKKEIWGNLIFFRDYLNANELARRQYLEIKLEYLRKASTGVNEYTNHKESFVQSIFEMRKW